MPTWFTVTASEKLVLVARWRTYRISDVLVSVMLMSTRVLLDSPFLTKTPVGAARGSWTDQSLLTSTNFVVTAPWVRVSGPCSYIQFAQPPPPLDSKNWILNNAVPTPACWLSG